VNGRASQMSPDQSAIGSESRRRWLAVHVLVFAVGGASAGAVMRFMGEPYYGVMTSSLEAAFIQAKTSGVAFLIFGAFVGMAQWLVLRRSLRAAWWVPATGLGWGLAGVVSGFNAGGSVSTIGPDAGPIDPLLAWLVGAPLVVVFLGGGQWLILRRDLEGAGWWPLVNMVGLILGFSVGFAVAKIVPWLAPTDFPSAKALGIVGAVAGLVYGGVTWQFLAELRRRDAAPPAGRVRRGATPAATSGPTTRTD
jgi:hypothetical protein